jgi:hypothetical protein
MTYDEAVQYAQNIREDVNIMLDERSGKYHVIRLFAVEHWRQHYKDVATVRVQMLVTLL